MTVVIFGYVDFLNGKLIIEDEIALRGRKMLTDSLAQAIKEKEAQLWTHPMTGEVKVPTMRISDNNNLILINDLAAKHILPFVPTQKDNKDAALNNMRMMLRGEQIIIHPRCKTLIYHLSAAVWSKDRRTYARSSDAGHFDAVDALVYLCRNISIKKNPYPANYNLIGAESVYFREDERKTGSTDFEKQLTRMVSQRSPFKLRNRFSKN